MPFDFNSFLVLAAELAVKPDLASQRSAISRAYYTAYHLAFSRAEQKVGTYSSRQDKRLPTHAWCWQQYEGTNDKTCQQIGINGSRMKARRVKADYNAADIPQLAQEAARQVQEARQFQTDIAVLDPRYPQP